MVKCTLAAWPGQGYKKIIIFPDERSLEQYRDSINQMDVTTVKMHTSQQEGKKHLSKKNKTKKGRKKQLVTQARSGQGKATTHIAPCCASGYYCLGLAIAALQRHVVVEP